MIKKRKRSKPKKLTTKTHVIRTRESSGDLVEIQIQARLKKVPVGFKITKELLESMVRRKAATSTGHWETGRGAFGCSEGLDPKGIELKIIRWRNPNRKNPALRGWREGSQAEAWGTLRRVLRQIQL